MSAGPQVQLAVLWPWLLMATLQAGLGHTGLALAAAVESERAAAQKAIIRVIPLKVEPIILEGEFANVAEVTPAEGKLLQAEESGDEMVMEIDTITTISRWDQVVFTQGLRRMKLLNY
ncbi:hypothetical protein DUI87_12630 [Hirundo rustica rustica]|uniref:Uncharacterized protein n=1 Tax=Hirundo rustica rustica TaxID=333673 RepID=A0A3M0KUZ0_HIRRU|nr:hypothetical protein DUI87_12630 [Hirundo rustica rustica]